MSRKDSSSCNGVHLPRSKSLPGPWINDDVFSSDPPQDSGVVGMGSDGSEPRSSLLCGELPSGASELPSCEKKEETKRATIGRHYYPEGGWGWIVLVMAFLVHVMAHGLHQAAGVFLVQADVHFAQRSFVPSSCLGALSISAALLVSPATIAICRRHSTRLTAVLGGLVTALGCLFSSFASQYHQLFFSYGAVVGVGVSLTRDSSCLMVGQYFKRRREFVEVILVSGSGLGISLMSSFVKSVISSIGWRLGLQAVTGVIFLTFFMGTFYRSASLYHPQRRAILHLKNQKRKIKDRSRQEAKPPFFDTATLKSRTVQILLASIALSSFGITTPIVYLANQAEQEGLEDSSIVLLQTYLGLGWVLGCCVFGFLVVQKSTDCRIGRQYLCQASLLLCGVATLAFTAFEGYHSYVFFAWMYGIFSGGFHYSLKMYTYEKVRARNFARTWGFVQCSQALPTALGVPITGYINISFGNKAGYYFSSTFIIFGSMTFFLIDVHRRNAARHRHVKEHGGHHTCVKETCPEGKRKDSLAQLDVEPNAFSPLAILRQRPMAYPDGALDPRTKQELTCISEEGIADMDLPDHLLEELEFFGDCITSCDKVENYLILSEYENNLVKTNEVYPYEKRNKKKSISFSRNPTMNESNGTTVVVEPIRRGSLAAQERECPRRNSNAGVEGGGGGGGGGTSSQESSSSTVLRNVTTYKSAIPVIEEASV